MSTSSRKNGAIAASILVILGMTYLTIAWDSNTNPTFLDRERALVSAKTYAVKAYPNLRFVGVDCSERLTNGDFFCPVEMKDQEIPEPLIYVLCPVEGGECSEESY